jgi:octaprenyl-diphosphate synthase
MTPAMAPNPVDALAASLAEDLRATEAVIAERMESPVGLIPDIAHHLVDAGGKRLRPLLTLAAAQACGGGGEAAVKLAAAVEFIHTATLLHDDVVDGSALRRGRRAANLIWGGKASVLVGDFLFARAFNLMVETGSIEVLDILAHASSVIAEGEVMQLAATARGDASRAAYAKVIEAKTAALFRAATQAGALTADAPPPLVGAFSAYGLNLGLAFQLVDDALDYGGATGALGKNVGDDFREGKATFPMIVAMERGDARERAFWQRMLAKQHSPEDLGEAIALAVRHGAIEATLDEARRHADLACAALRDGFADAGATAGAAIVEHLCQLSGHVVGRAS